MSIASPGPRQVGAPARFALPWILVFGCSATGWGQTDTIPRDTGRREAKPLITIPAPCNLRPERRLRLEDNLRSILLSWIDGSDGARRLDSEWQRAVDTATGFAVTDVTVHRLPSSPSGSVIVPYLGCYEKAEQRVLKSLSREAPETLPALFDFYLEAYTQQIGSSPGRRWMAARSRDRLVWLAAQHKNLMPRSPEEKADRARMLMMLADVMRSAPFTAEMREAVELLEQVVDLVPESVAARYMAATLAERIGDYEATVRQFVRLAKIIPDDAEVALRLAINRGRTGDTRLARRDLEAVARGGGAAWIRILAYQEWVKLESGKRAVGARAVLEEALTAFPGERQLSLQLAAALIHARRWHQAERALDRTAAAIAPTDEGSPRSLYDLPRRDELEAEQRRLGIDIETGILELRRLLAAGLPRPHPNRLATHECEDLAQRFIQYLDGDRGDAPRPANPPIEALQLIREDDTLDLQPQR